MSADDFRRTKNCQIHVHFETRSLERELLPLWSEIPRLPVWGSMAL